MSRQISEFENQEQMEYLIEWRKRKDEKKRKRKERFSRFLKKFKD